VSFFYHIFGLVVESQIECPELTPAAGQPNPDVQICARAVPAHLNGGIAAGEWLEGCRGQMLLRIKGIAAYRISFGREIAVDASVDASPEDIRIYLLGSAMGALLHQRGLLPFHGSTVCIGERAITFSGPSGVGKSTLAAALVDKGCRMLADDVSAVSFTDSGMPTVNPGIPQLKLCADAAQRLGRAPSHARPPCSRDEKYGYPEHSAFVSHALPSGAIYIIGKHPDNGFEEIPLKGAKKFNALRVNAYRPLFVKAMEMEQLHFDLLGKLAARADVRILLRPADRFRIDELANHVLNSETRR
jgi:hypothetical protein